MVRRGQIVVLSSVVIPPENTPEKLISASLVAHPVWKYAGPACTINLEWQIGKWNSTFNGITTRKYDTRSQPASSELKEFTTDLTAIPLSGLSLGYYDCEIWFKSSAFSDLRVIVQNCVRVVEAPTGYSLEVTVQPSGYGYVTVSPSKTKYSAGEQVTLTATPYSGYEFDHWEGL